MNPMPPPQLRTPLAAPPHPVLTRGGWATVTFVAYLLFVLVPALNLLVPEGHAFHLSDYFVTLPYLTYNDAMKNQGVKDFLGLLFNTKIKKELEKRFPANFTVMTLNGLGHRALPLGVLGHPGICKSVRHPSAKLIGNELFGPDFGLHERAFNVFLGCQVQMKGLTFLPIAGNLQHGRARQAAVCEQKVFIKTHECLFGASFDAHRQ